ncbi:hypothetical protein ACFQ14_12605 [Pseudahrensia aquimaris]|uniref:Uncharacterized protein n=1 Tax=Pseudahrensia aquimaris TaxID=744461 RepID=A0ABW3FIE1_9HYPH
MRLFQSSIGNGTSSVIGINAKLLYAALLAIAAYYIWPPSAEWWGFGFISVCFALSALGLLVDAIKSAVKLYGRERVIADITDGAKQPQSSRLASEADLDRIEALHD